MNRVVITGIGIYSCLGTNKQEVLSSLSKGSCGLSRDEERLEHGFRSPLTGKLPSPNIPKPLRRFMSRGVEYLYTAAKEALEDAGDVGRCGVIIGNDSSAKAMLDAFLCFLNFRDTSKLGPTHVIKTLSSNPTAVLTSLLPLRGVSFSIGGACASGGHAIGVAYNLIKGGVEESILCGGCQEVNEASVFSFDALGNFSTAEDPSTAVRPFDNSRCGLVPSGGGACLVLESLTHATLRGARIYGEIIGYGANSSGSLAASTVESEVECMKLALGDLSYDKIDLVSAHATGTQQGDAVEAEAILQVFPHLPYVIATKAMTGHEMWMAGASELIYAILASKAKFIPPNINTKDYSLNLNIKRNLVPEETSEFILSNSFGLGGTNSSIVVKVNYGEE
ncbi:beta-ketoacyl-[acyl-carrier-protein] synthase family protein [Intestinibacter sp.]|uniref:beta-ketoacyl-[acyl-carrier-protein] synthase family protein n=1 Tax=Intestinibacter sp. TaxID=1965304 RepID=UPI003F1494CE